MLFLLTLGVVNALQYDINLNVLPVISGSGIGCEDSTILVFGHIKSLNDASAISPSDLQIKIVDSNGDVVATYKPDYVDFSSNKFVFDGYFYKKIPLSEGDYVVSLRAGDSREFKFVNIKDNCDSDIEVIPLDYSIEGENINVGLSVKNLDSTNHDIKLVLVTDNGYSKSTHISVGGDSSILTSVILPLSDVGDISLIGIFGYALDETNLISEPKYIQISSGKSSETHLREMLEITNISLSKKIFFPGDLVEGKIYIKNTGTTTAQYRFKYVYDNVLYTKGEAGYIEPGETAVEPFFIEVPNTDLFNVTFKVYNEYSESELTKTFLVSHRFKDFFIDVKDKSFDIDESGNFTLNVTVYNTGTLDDTYTIDVSNWSYYEVKDNVITIPAGLSNVFTINFEVPEGLRVGGYLPQIKICNTDGKCVTKEITINVNVPEEKQSEITWNESQDNISFTGKENITYTIGIKNIGNSQKQYRIEIEAPEGLNYSISEESFSLGVDESKEINFTLVPNETEDYNATLRVYSNGEKIFERNLTLEYKESGILTGMFISNIGGPYVPGLVALAVIGILALVYAGYVGITRYIWTKKVLEYTRTHPQRLTGY